MQKLLLAEEVFDELDNNKAVTIRKGRRNIQLGDLIFESADQKRRCYVTVVSTMYCKLANVYIKDLKNDGFRDHDDLCAQMQRFYPGIDFNTEVTVVSFTNVHRV